VLLQQLPGGIKHKNKLGREAGSLQLRLNARQLKAQGSGALRRRGNAKALLDKVPEDGGVGGSPHPLGRSKLQRAAQLLRIRARPGSKGMPKRGGVKVLPRLAHRLGLLKVQGLQRKHLLKRVG
jgi:hypothetical protein